MSALRSSAGPAVCTNGTSSSAATICASEVLPRPGGPASSTWSSASPRLEAAAIETPSCSRSASWPTNSSSRRGRSVASGSSSGRTRAVCRRDSAGSTANTPGVRIGSGLTGGPRAARRRSGPRACRRRRRAAACRPPRACSRARAGASRASERGSSPRVMTIGSSASGTPTFSRSSTTIRSAVRLPIPGTACSRAVSPAATAPSSSRGGPPESTASAIFGPTDCTPISSRNRSRSSSVAKP